MGTNNWNYFFNGDIAGLFAVDEFLSTDATTAIANAMVQGVDLTSAPCAATASSCVACPVGTTSAVGSSNISSCVSAGCGAGSTGPDGGPGYVRGRG
jgi:hypothetical protein